MAQLTISKGAPEKWFFFFFFVSDIPFREMQCVGVLRALDHCKHLTCLPSGDAHSPEVNISELC